MGRVPLLARQLEGSACRTLASPARLRTILQCPARYDHRSFSRDLQSRRGGTAPRYGAGAFAMSAFRIANGGRVDRSRPLRFRFDGRLLEGLQGDTLASALLANGVHLVGRSFKYHRPRGILTAGANGASALVPLPRDASPSPPHLRGTPGGLYAGLDSQ